MKLPEQGRIVLIFNELCKPDNPRGIPAMKALIEDLVDFVDFNVELGPDEADQFQRLRLAAQVIMCDFGRGSCCRGSDGQTWCALECD